MGEQARFVSVSVDREPRGKPRVLGVSLVVDRGLKGGRVDTIPVSEDDLIRMIGQAADALAVLRKEDVSDGE